MSIIHDALKKVQASLDRKHGQRTVVAQERPLIKQEEIKASFTSAQQRPYASPQHSSTKMIFFLANGVLIALGIIIVLLLKLFDQSPQTKGEPSALLQQRLSTLRRTQPAQSTQAIQRAPTTTPAAMQALATTQPSQVPAYKEGLELNGTMLMDNRNVALINGEVYEMGERVEGYLITSITLKDVTLLNEADGTTTTLRTRNR